MYPQQPNSPPLDPNQFDFITNPGVQAKRSLVDGTSITARIIVCLVGLFILLILFVGVKSVLGSGGGNSDALIKVVNRQQEIVTVTTAATSGTQQLDSNSSAIAVTTQVSLTSAQSQMLTYLKTKGLKVTKKQLIYVGNTAITDQLAAASAAGNYDTTLQVVLKDLLIDYQATLKQAYAKTTGARGRELLQQEYDGASILLRQFGTPVKP